jgi:hypothetical protein
MKWEEANALCDEIVEMIDDEVPESAKEKAEEFFDGVRERTISIQEWIATNKKATDKQVTALQNMKQSVQKWIRDE